ncbi:hypothetical protein BH11VER1_BH11VER1_38430 [soil metagenome]
MRHSILNPLILCSLRSSAVNPFFFLGLKAVTFANYKKHPTQVNAVTA